MQENNIQDLIAQFYREAEKLSSDLGKVNGQLREGRAPSEAQIEKLTENLSGIRKQYEAVYDAAQKLSPETLKMERTVEEYLKAAEIGIQTQRLAELLELRAVLDEFLSIRSNKEKYETMLDPLRLEVYDLLDAMEKPRLEDVDSLFERVQGPRYFVEAVHEPLGSERLGMLIEEKLNDRYPAELLMGFFTRAFVFGDGPVPRPEAAPAAGRRQKGRRTAAEPKKAAAKKPAAAQAGPAAAAKKPAPVPKPPKPAEAPRVLWGPTSGESLTTTEATNRVKTAQANGSSFRSKLVRMMDPDMITAPILQLLDVFGAGTARQLTDLGRIERVLFDPDGNIADLVAKVLENLADRGWIASYRLDGAEEPVYGITEYAAGSMRKETVQKQFRNEWPLAFSARPRTYSAKEATARLEKEVAQKEALIAYFRDRTGEIGFDVYYDVLDKVGWDDDHFVVLVYSRGQESPQRYHMVSPAAAASVRSGEPVLIIGDPRFYGRDFIDGWQAPVMYLDPFSGYGTLRPAREAFSAEYDSDESVRSEQRPAALPPRSASEGETRAGLFDSRLLSDIGPLDDSRLAPLVTASLKRSCPGERALQEAVVETVALAKAGALADGVREGKRFSQQLQLAANVLIDDLDYTGAQLEEVFPVTSEHPEVLLFGAYAFGLLAPALEGDFLLLGRGRALVEDYDQWFRTLPWMRSVLKLLLETAEKTRSGFSPAAVGRLGGESDQDQFLHRIMEEAANHSQALTPNVNLKALAPIYKKIFGIGSPFQRAMKAIAADDRSARSMVEDVLAEFCTVNEHGTRTVSAERIDAVLDEYWDTYCRNKQNRKLSYHARDQLIRLMRVRLDVMLHWTEYLDSLEQSPKDQSELRRLQSQLRKAIDAALSEPAMKDHEEANLIRWILSRLKSRIAAPVADERLFDVFLLTGHVMLDEDGRPLLDSRFADVARYAPWSLVAQHIEDRSGRRHHATFKEIREEIEGSVGPPDPSLMDNFQQLRMIGLLTDEPESECAVDSEEMSEAAEYADSRFEEFEERLELYHMLGQITEEDKTALREMALSHQEFFYETGNFASWREFLRAVAWEAGRHAQKRIDLLLDQIEERRDRYGESPQLDAAAEFLEREVPNMTLAEEAINAYDMGDMPDAVGAEPEEEFFENFCKDVVFRTLYEECRRQGTGTSARPLKRFGVSFFEKHHPPEWTAEDVSRTTQLLQNWPASKGAPTTKHIVTVLQRLGFEITGAERTQMLRNAELYIADAVPPKASGGPYGHPIAAFGTQLPEKLEVAVIYGQCTGEDLFSTLAQLKTEGTPIVLLDYQLDQGQRRVIAELFRTHSDQKTFLLVDRVLAMYLSMAPPDSRVSALLQCTLPYAGIQPFADETLPDELFCGRREETGALLSRESTSIVYGGCKTGKTALLRHVQRCGTRPEEKQFYVYADARGAETEQALAAVVAEEVNAALPGAEISGATLDDLASSLRSLYDSPAAPDFLAVIVDHADDFLAAASPDGEQLAPLAALREEREGSFKLMLAGSVHVARAYRASQEKEGALARLGDSMRLGQLPQPDAEKLLTGPLRYLGFTASEHGEIETMISNTNCYPGVVKELGRTLVNTLAEHSSSFYSAARDNPPYPLRSTELGAVLHSPELHRHIRETVLESLHLDRRYEAIGQCVAWLCLSEGSSVRRSYTPDEIQSVAQAYNTPVLRSESPESFRVLLEEMTDMGLLLRTSEGEFRLRRDAFLDVIGRDQTLLEEQLGAAGELRV
ncbi:MAG: hypothetical protein HDQ87_11650 [Clostridia bacterium]|nr:hypothetical protein [Clostridia bacterium]